MNRREFTASLAALAASPALPFPAATPAAAAQIPAGAYAWGQLIARAQNSCTPAMLARQLRLSSDVAQSLFDTMLRDGVLRAPDVAGVVRAAQPIDATGTRHPITSHLRDKAKGWLDATLTEEERSDDAPPLVKPDDPGLGCAHTSKDAADARTDQPVQESPERG